MAADGYGNEETTSRLDTRREVASNWRKRFFEQGLPGLEERPRVGRPPVFPPEVAAAAKALACELPSRLGVPLSRLHVPDIAAEVVSRGLVAEISGTTIWRWLSEDAIHPWKCRSWIYPRDPLFEAKAGRVLDLYAREWEEEPLGKKDFSGLGQREDLHPGTRPLPPEPSCGARAQCAASSSSTNGAAPCSISPPGMCIGPR